MGRKLGEIKSAEISNNLEWGPIERPSSFARADVVRKSQTLKQNLICSSGPSIRTTGQGKGMRQSPMKIRNLYLIVPKLFVLVPIKLGNLKAHLKGYLKDSRANLKQYPTSQGSELVIIIERILL